MEPQNNKEGSCVLESAPVFGKTVGVEEAVGIWVV